MSAVRRMIRRWPAAVAVLPVLLVAGCRSVEPMPVAGRYVDGRAGYVISLPAGEWQAVRDDSSGLVIFRPPGVSGRIAVQVTSMPAGKSGSVEVLARELLSSFKDRSILKTRRCVVAQCEAISQDWTATIEGQRVRARSYVLAFRRRIYDIVAWAPEKRFAPLGKVFETFVAGFQLPSEAGGGEGAEQGVAARARVVRE